MRKYCEEIAAKVWHELANSNLVTAEKLGKLPDIRFAALGDKFLGLAYSDHIELHDKYLHSTDRDRLKMILLHELAHVAEFRCTGIMGHGPLWHAICIDIGGSGDARGDLPLDTDFADTAIPNADSDSSEILFGFAAIIALAGALFSGIYFAIHCLGITNKIFCGAFGIGGIVFSVILWAACCKTFDQVKCTVCLQAFLSVVFMFGVLL